MSAIIVKVPVWDTRGIADPTAFGVLVRWVHSELTAPQGE
jgi:hypothetical protein